jgi:hypothetical protein
MIIVINIAMISFCVESTATGDSEALLWKERYVAISEVGETLAEVRPLGAVSGSGSASMSFIAAGAEETKVDFTEESDNWHL